MKNNKGFSLVELVIVIAIMAILVGVAVPVFSSYVEKSAKEKDIALVDEMADAIVLANNSGYLQFEVAGQYSEGLQIPVGYIVISDTKLKGDNYVEVIGQGVDASVLKDALAAKFGAGYATELSLSYDGWNGNVGAFFANASTMVDKVDTLGTNVLTAVKLLGGLDENGNVNIIFVGKKNIFSRKYNTSEELLLSVAEKVAGADQEDFKDAWLNVSTPDQEKFALPEDEEKGGKLGREHYSAVRGAYNICFATFASQNGHPDHGAEIENFGKTIGELIHSSLSSIGTSVNFPQTVCQKVFDPSYEKYNQYEFTKCATCKDLYDQYRQSPQAESDANNFFNMMVTGNKLEPDVYAGEGLFKYMKAQATPFQKASTDINELVKGKSAIVLTVYYTKEGQIVVDFTPIDATP